MVKYSRLAWLVCLVVAVVLVVVLRRGDDLAANVDPMIGTAATGHTYPGAVALRRPSGVTAGAIG